MPAILQLLLRLLGGIGGGALASRAIPSLVSKVAPRLAAQGARSIGFGPVKGTLGGIGKGVSGFGGFIAGDVIAGVGLDAALPGIEPPPEPGIEAIAPAQQQNSQFGREQALDLQRLFSEAELTQVLASLGIDPDLVLSQAQSFRGIV